MLLTLCPYKDNDYEQYLHKALLTLYYIINYTRVLRRASYRILYVYFIFTVSNLCCHMKYVVLYDTKFNILGHN